MDKEFPKNAPVAVTECGSYDADRVYAVLKDQFLAVGADASYFRDRRVALKPNLVAGKDPSAAVTTHPAVVEAVFRLVSEFGASDVVLAESPGGSFTVPILSRIYSVTGMRDVSERTGLALNEDISSVAVSFPEGRKLKKLDVLTPIDSADVIVDICKLKTHSLTGLSCAVKNLFGVVPGTVKFEMHASYPEIDDFSEMLCDLDLALYRGHDVLAVCDAVVSMEGNGPTHGKPVKTGFLMTSLSTFALDVAAEHYAGIDGTAKFLDVAAEKGIVERDWNKIRVIGGLADREPVQLELPDSKKTGLSMRILKALPNLFGGRFSRYFEPRPKISKGRCIGCGNCVKVCPQKTIVLEKSGKKKIAKIKRSDCIRCFCCQELCPHGAVDTVRNTLIRIIR